MDNLEIIPVYEVENIKKKATKLIYSVQESVEKVVKLLERLGHSDTTYVEDRKELYVIIVVLCKVFPEAVKIWKLKLKEGDSGIKYCCLALIETIEKNNVSEAKRIIIDDLDEEEKLREKYSIVKPSTVPSITNGLKSFMGLEKSFMELEEFEKLFDKEVDKEVDKEAVAELIKNKELYWKLQLLAKDLMNECDNELTRIKVKNILILFTEIDTKYIIEKYIPKLEETILQLCSAYPEAINIWKLELEANNLYTQYSSLIETIEKNSKFEKAGNIIEKDIKSKETETLVVDFDEIY